MDMAFAHQCKIDPASATSSRVYGRFECRTNSSMDLVLLPSWQKFVVVRTRYIRVGKWWRLQEKGWKPSRATCCYRMLKLCPDKADNSNDRLPSGGKPDMIGLKHPRRNEYGGTASPTPLWCIIWSQVLNVCLSYDDSFIAILSLC